MIEKLSSQLTELLGILARRQTHKETLILFVARAPDGEWLGVGIWRGCVIFFCKFPRSFWAFFHLRQQDLWTFRFLRQNSPKNDKFFTWPFMILKLWEVASLNFEGRIGQDWSMHLEFGVVGPASWCSTLFVGYRDPPWAEVPWTSSLKLDVQDSSESLLFIVFT